VTKINKINKLKSDQCRHFVCCSAPLCPLDEKHLKADIWYPDEEICRLKTVPNWVKIQKKIVKKTKDKNTYYSYKMLNHNCKVGTGMTGLNPDRPEELQLIAWLKKHPPKKAISEKQKKMLIEARKKSPLATLKEIIVACL
jgi:hypothetical protein